eukprot:m51a1_g1502 hypothetical protein (710) ;mRNA; r:355442-361878
MEPQARTARVEVVVEGVGAATVEVCAGSSGEQLSWCVHAVLVQREWATQLDMVVPWVPDGLPEAFYGAYTELRDGKHFVPMDRTLDDGFFDELLSSHSHIRAIVRAPAVPDEFLFVMKHKEESRRQIEIALKAETEKRRQVELALEAETAQRRARARVFDATSPEAIRKTVEEFGQFSKLPLKGPKEPNYRTDHAFQGKFLGREEGVRSYSEYMWTRFHWPDCMGAKDEDRHRNKIAATAGAPGTGKSRLIDFIADNAKLIAERAVRPFGASEDAERSLRAAAEDTVPLLVSYNGWSPYNGNLEDSAIEANLALRVLATYFFNLKPNHWDKFANWAREGIKFNSLTLIEALRAIFLGGHKAAFLAVDEVVKADPNFTGIVTDSPEERKAAAPHVILISTIVGKALDTFSRNDGQKGPVLFTLVTSLNTLLVHNVATDSGRYLHWIGMPLLSFESAEQLFSDLEPDVVNQSVSQWGSDNRTFNFDTLCSKLEGLIVQDSRAAATLTLHILRPALLEVAVAQTIREHLLTGYSLKCGSDSGEPFARFHAGWEALCRQLCPGAITTLSAHYFGAKKRSKRSDGAETAPNLREVVILPEGTAGHDIVATFVDAKTENTVVVAIEARYSDVGSTTEMSLREILKKYKDTVKRYGDDVIVVIVSFRDIPVTTLNPPMWEYENLVVVPKEAVPKMYVPRTKRAPATATATATTTHK